jgi:hypothetical protein
MRRVKKLGFGSCDRTGCGGKTEDGRRVMEGSAGGSLRCGFVNRLERGRGGRRGMLGAL